MMKSWWYMGIVVVAACSSQVDLDALAGSTGAATGSGQGGGVGATSGAGQGGSASTSTGGGGDAGCSGASCGGVCVDLTSDPGHCGACGHDCLGGACAGSRCQPVTVASGQTSPQVIAVSNGYLYWGEYGGAMKAIRRAPTAGGAVETLATDPRRVFAIAVNDTSVYWAGTSVNEFETAILWVPLSGGTVTTIAEGGPFSVDGSSNGIPMALSPAGLFFGYFNSGTQEVGIAISSLDGTSVAPFDSTSGSVMGLAADATWLYTIGKSGPGLWKYPLGGGPKTVVSSDNMAIGAELAVDDTHAYMNHQFANQLIMVTPATGQAQGFGTSSTLAARAIAIDDTYVYWTNFPAGMIQRMPKGGGPVEAIAEKQNLPVDIAVDDDAVYWTNSGGDLAGAGAIMKIAK